MGPRSNGPLAPGPGLRKFVDKLPGLGPAGANGLVTPTPSIPDPYPLGRDPSGQYIPVAVPDITTYLGSDYYEIAVVEYTEKMHRDLPPTKLRGYIQLNYGTDTACLPNCTTANNTVAPNAYPHYLGPTILAQKDRPVRILFRNAANDRFWNLQWYVADATGTEVALKPSEVAAAQVDPVTFPTPQTECTTYAPCGPAGPSPAGPGLAADRHRGRLPAGPGGRPEPADHLGHRRNAA